MDLEVPLLLSDEAHLARKHERRVRTVRARIRNARTSSQASKEITVLVHAARKCTANGRKREGNSRRKDRIFFYDMQPYTGGVVKPYWWED